MTSLEACGWFVVNNNVASDGSTNTGSAANEGNSWYNVYNSELRAYVSLDTVAGHGGTGAATHSLRALLQVIRHQLLHPEAMHNAVYPRLTANQMTTAYLKQILDVDFPRLLLVLHELGGVYGAWSHDGDEIGFSFH